MLTGARSFVRGVAWAAPGGRSKDLVATGSADGFVRIYEVWTPRGRGVNGGSPEDSQTRADSGQLALRQVPSGIGAGLAGARREGERGLEPGQILHDWRCVAELKHEGAWLVKWIRDGKSRPCDCIFA